MNRLDQLERQIAELNPEEMKQLRAWFQRLDDEQWDRQIEAGSQSGKLPELAEKALRDYRAGLSTEL